MDKKKKIWIACGGAALLAIVIYFSISATRRDEVEVQTAEVKLTETLTSKIAASGEIRAKEFVDLQTEIAGVVTDLPIQEGDRVKKGDVLLRIDPIQTEAETNSILAALEAQRADSRVQEFQILTAESNLARDGAALRSAEAELRQAEHNNTKAENTFRRQQLLHEDGLISSEEYELAQNNARSAVAQLDVSKARLSQMQTQVLVAKNSIEQMKASYQASQERVRGATANLTRAQDQLKKTTIRSPLDGVITQLIVEKGERAVPGIMSNPQATLMTIANLNVIQAELKVDETDIVNLSIGDKAEIKVDALPEDVLEGEVTEIGNSPINAGTGQQEAKDFKVVVTLIVPSPKLRPGMSCTGDIITDVKQGVLTIPIQALTIREVEVDEEGNYIAPDPKTVNNGTASNGSDSEKEEPEKKELEGVFVVGSDKVAKFRPLETGITGETDIEVLENLEQGEEIITGSFKTLRTIQDGAYVKVNNSTETDESKS